MVHREIDNARTSRLANADIYPTLIRRSVARSQGRIARIPPSARRARIYTVIGNDGDRPPPLASSPPTPEARPGLRVIRIICTTHSTRRGAPRRADGSSDKDYFRRFGISADPMGSASKIRPTSQRAVFALHGSLLFAR
jgi:hypothetical protein